MFKKILTTIGLTTAILVLLATSVHAYQIDPSYRPTNSPFALETEIKEKGSAGALVLVLQIISSGLLYFAAPIAIIMMGFGAFDMVLGSGESEKIDQAKKHFTWAIIGLFVIILSYSLVKVVISLVIASAAGA